MRVRVELGIAPRFSVDDEIDVALAVERDVLALMLRHRGKAHSGEQLAQQRGVGRGIFDELEAVGTHRVVEAEHGFFLDCAGHAHTPLRASCARTSANSRLAKVGKVGTDTCVRARACARAVTWRGAERLVMVAGLSQSSSCRTGKSRWTCPRDGRSRTVAA